MGNDLTMRNQGAMIQFGNMYFIFLCNRFEYRSHNINSATILVSIHEISFDKFHVSSKADSTSIDAINFDNRFALVPKSFNQFPTDQPAPFV